MEKPSTARISLKWGMITAILVIIFTIILYVTGMFKNPYLSWGGFLLLIFGIVMAIREFKTFNNGFLNFGEGLGVGALTSAVTGIVASAFNLIYTHFIDTTIMEQMRNMQLEQLEKQGLSTEQIDQAMEMASKFTSPSLVFLFGIIGYILFGFIFSLIITAILKNSKSEMDF